MLLTISNTSPAPSDLGFLLHKHPDRVHQADLAFGKATVFYPDSTEDRCTAALHVEVDPVGLVRRGDRSDSFALEQYVNDRPYVACSLLSVAVSRVFGTALSGRCNKKPELVEQQLDLEARLAAVPLKGNPELFNRLFEPLGYSVSAERHVLDPEVPDWGDSNIYSLALQVRTTVKSLLSHLYVLIPVLDKSKHYWVGDAEVDKLLRHGESWLSAHPEKPLITRRYLRNQRSLVNAALDRLIEDETNADDESPSPEEVIEKPERLNTTRLKAVRDALRGSGARSVIDLGCGEGRLLRLLLREKSFERIVGMDVSHRSLEIAERRLRLATMPERQRRRIELIHGSLTYRDRRLEGFEAAALVEVIEHLDPGPLRALRRTVFEFARPEAIVVTTPNREYNSQFETLPAGRFRHPDHRFEWTRSEFETWTTKVASEFGYSVEFSTVGPVVEGVGSPTQMATFRRLDIREMKLET